MSPICQRVYDRVKEFREERGQLNLSHFAELGLEVDSIYECMKDFERDRLVRETGPVRRGHKEGRRFIMDFWFQITDHGRAAFKNDC